MRIKVGREAIAINGFQSGRVDLNFNLSFELAGFLLKSINPFPVGTAKLTGEFFNNRQY